VGGVLRLGAGPLRNQAKRPACFLRGLREPRQTAGGFPSAGGSQPKLPGRLPPHIMGEKQ